MRARTKEKKFELYQHYKNLVKHWLIERIMPYLSQAILEHDKYAIEKYKRLANKILNICLTSGREYLGQDICGLLIMLKKRVLEKGEYGILNTIEKKLKKELEAKEAEITKEIQEELKKAA